MKLYKVYLKGNFKYQKSYVVAENLNQAYGKVKMFLEDNDCGFKEDRELYAIEIIAGEIGEDDYFGDIKLFLK